MLRNWVCIYKKKKKGNIWFTIYGAAEMLAQCAFTINIYPAVINQTKYTPHTGKEVFVLNQSHDSFKEQTFQQNEQIPKQVYTIFPQLYIYIHIHHIYKFQCEHNN